MNNNVNGSSKTDVLIKLSLVFFISLLSFSIGTFVGKKFSDNQHKLSALEQNTGDRQTASVGNDSKQDDALANEEFAKLAEEFITEENTATASSESATHETKSTTETTKNSETPANSTVSTNEPAKETSKESAKDSHVTSKEVPVAKVEAAHAKDTIKEVKTVVKDESKPQKETKEVKVEKAMTAATKIAEGKSPVEDNKPASKDIKQIAKEMKQVAKDASRVPSSVPEKLAASNIGKYTVQVASYPSEAEAQKMANELKSKGFSAFYIPAQIKGQNWFRVSVGLFSTQEEASTFRTKLMEQAKISSAIIQKITK